MRDRIIINNLTPKTPVYLLNRKGLTPEERVIRLQVERRGAAVRLHEPTLPFDVTVEQGRLDEDFTSTVPVYFLDPAKAHRQYDEDQKDVRPEATP